MNNTNLNISPEYFENLYGKWLLNPMSFSIEWQNFFKGFLFCIDYFVSNKGDTDTTLDQYNNIIYFYFRNFGYQYSCVNPLLHCNILSVESVFSEINVKFGVNLSIDNFNFSKYTDTIEKFFSLYCRNVGFELSNIKDDSIKKWLFETIETSNVDINYPVTKLLSNFTLLHKAHRFETFLHTNYPAQKRFSLEGSEVLILTLDEIVQKCSSYRVSDAILGMPHRGRLNVLANILHKPVENIFAEFRDDLKNGFQGDGDVKYHKGYSCDIHSPDGILHLSLVPNPSHLEAVNSVVEGKARARQDHYGRRGFTSVLPILIHGESAFAGQGSVAEVLNLANLDGYSTGGTLHIVINNQIGFTTSPHDSRSSQYSTDIAKMLACPIFHVQGESPDAILYIVNLALEYRQRFSRDVIIELVCYRRHGHNEADEPAFTQPLMYRNLKTRPSVSTLYANTILEQGVSQEQLISIEHEIDTYFADVTKSLVKEHAIGFSASWSTLNKEFSSLSVDTTCSQENILRLSRRLADLPPGFIPHHKISALMQKRFESILKNLSIDWGTAETLAYATLLDSGVSVRISGQDSRRGTFSHRHAVLHDMNDDSTYTPLCSVCADGAWFQVWDSPLSEYAVLGFEYGYSLETPHGLTIWEAQFGDFANGAQVIIDQFISSGETKWNRASGLVMYLPHGYEGQGAEHSSARIERFLQLCAGNNMVVVNPSTPSQLFHLLRRQVLQSFRKPLVVFTPKSLLRHPGCISTTSDLCNGRFQEVINDPEHLSNVRKVLFCSGKIYYELVEEREKRSISDVAIVRIEQLYPLRFDLIEEIISIHSGSAFVWVQEEPKNMGPWQHMFNAFYENSFHLQYVGRSADGCPAVGSHKIHAEQQHDILEAALLQ